MNINSESLRFLRLFLRNCPTVFLLLFTIAAAAQPRVQWDKTFGGADYDDLTTASITVDGGYLLCGVTLSPKGYDVSEVTRDAPNSVKRGDYWIVKTDADGNKIFDKRYGGSGQDICWKVIQNDAGYLLIGQSDSNISGDKTENSRGGIDFWLIQVRPSGDYVWDKTYGGNKDDVPFSAVKTPDGNYIIAGHSDSDISGDKSEADRGGLDLWILKVDKNGNKIWDKTFGGDLNDDYPTALIRLQNGHYLVGCGSSSNATGDKTSQQRGVKDMWIVEFDESGNKITDKSFGGSDEDALFGLQQVADGSVFLAGTSKSDIGGDKSAINFGDYDYWLVKTDKNYNKLWDKTYGGKAKDNLTFIDQNKTGYILIGGNSSSNPGGNKKDSIKGLTDFWLLYLNENGDIIWDKNYGGAGNDSPKDLIKTSDGNYIICGVSASNKGFDKSEDSRGLDEKNTKDDFWIIKIKCFFDLRLGNDTIVCHSKTLYYDATIPNCANCLYSWSTGDMTAKIKIEPTVSQKISVTVTATDACVFKTDVSITLIPSPDSAHYLVNSPRCTDGKDGVIALDFAHGGTPPYFLVANKDTFLQRIFIDKLAAGNYDVTLVDKKGCTFSSKVFVPNPDPFIVGITPSLELNFGDSFRIDGTANHALSSFYWSDKSFKQLSNIAKPFDTQTYTFTGIDSLGCLKSAVMQVLVRRDNLYFAPQAFSPNGDLNNDIFQIFGGKTVLSIDNLQIFSRWGQLMYETAHIFPDNANLIGWNGTFNGDEAPLGVYIYKAVVTYIDGRSELIKGDVMLMR